MLNVARRGLLVPKKRRRMPLPRHRCGTSNKSCTSGSEQRQTTERLVAQLVSARIALTARSYSPTSPRGLCHDREFGDRDGK